MSDVYEVILLVECIIAIILVFVIIALAVSLKKRRQMKEKAVTVTVPAPAPKPEPAPVRTVKVLYDPNGMYAPVTAEQLKRMDARAKAFVDKQLQEGKFYSR